MEVKQEKQIDYRFRILYALAIFLVVAGHSDIDLMDIVYKWFPPYSCLGLFVFCSGYFYKEKSEQNVFKYIKDKFKKLIIPIYIWNFIYALVVYLLSFKGFTIGLDSRNIFLKLFVLPITDGHQFEYNLGGWFVIPLFMIEIFNVLFRKIKSSSKNETIYFALYLFFGLIGVYIASKGFNRGLWLILVRMLYLLPFYGLGIYYKKILEKHDKLSNIKYFSFIFIIALIIIIFKGKMPAYTPSWCYDFNDGPLVVFTVGFLSIAFWLRISKILEPIIGKSKIINILAANTYSIMIHHCLGFMMIKTVFAVANKLTGMFNDFDWNLFKSEVFYFYIPKDISQIRIIYLISGLLLPIGIQFAIDYFKRNISKIKRFKYIFTTQRELLN